MSSNAIPLIILAALLFLFYKALKSGGERPFADLSETEIALISWQTEHQYLHPGDYSSGKRLAEQCRDALLAVSLMVPSMKNDPEYLADLEYATSMAAPRHSGSFHAVA